MPKISSDDITGRVCTLKIVSGSAQVQKPGESKWQTISDEIDLVESARLKTDQETQASLTCPDNSLATIDSNTEMELIKANYNGKGTVITEIKQYSGKITSKVTEINSPDSSFVIDTPAAVISVMGTEFVTEITKDG
jgi:hypothetical protein